MYVPTAVSYSLRTYVHTLGIFTRRRYIVPRYVCMHKYREQVQPILDRFLTRLGGSFEYGRKMPTKALKLLRHEFVL
jgi:hypothetical protein